MSLVNVFGYPRISMLFKGELETLSRLTCILLSALTIGKQDKAPGAHVGQPTLERRIYLHVNPFCDR